MSFQHEMVLIDSVSTVIRAKILNLDFHHFDRGFFAMYIAGSLQVNIAGNSINKRCKFSYGHGNIPPSFPATPA